MDTPLLILVDDSLVVSPLIAARFDATVNQLSLISQRPLLNALQIAAVTTVCLFVSSPYYYNFSRIIMRVTQPDVLNHTHVHLYACADEM